MEYEITRYTIITTGLVDGHVKTATVNATPNNILHNLQRVVAIQFGKDGANPMEKLMTLLVKSYCGDTLLGAHHETNIKQYLEGSLRATQQNGTQPSGNNYMRYLDMMYRGGDEYTTYFMRATMLRMIDWVMLTNIDDSPPYNFDDIVGHIKKTFNLRWKPFSDILRNDARATIDIPTPIIKYTHRMIQANWEYFTDMIDPVAEAINHFYELTDFDRRVILPDPPSSKNGRTNSGPLPEE